MRLRLKRPKDCDTKPRSELNWKENRLGLQNKRDSKLWPSKGLVRKMKLDASMRLRRPREFKLKGSPLRNKKRLVGLLSRRNRLGFKESELWPRKPRTRKKGLQLKLLLVKRLNWLPKERSRRNKLGLKENELWPRKPRTRKRGLQLKQPLVKQLN